MHADTCHNLNLMCGHVSRDLVFMTEGVGMDGQCGVLTLGDLVSGW